MRLQLVDSSQMGVPKPTLLSIARMILVECRILDFYAGLFAGLFRQGIYTSSRLGFFDMFMKRLQHHHQVRNTTVNFAERCATGFLEGGLGALLANQRTLPWSECRPMASSQLLSGATIGRSSTHWYLSLKRKAVGLFGLERYRLLPELCH